MPMTRPQNRPAKLVPVAPDDDPPEGWDEEVLEGLPEEEQEPVAPS